MGPITKPAGFTLHPSRRAGRLSLAQDEVLGRLRQEWNFVPAGTYPQTNRGSFFRRVMQLVLKMQCTRTEAWLWDMISR